MNKMIAAAVGIAAIGVGAWLVFGDADADTAGSNAAQAPASTATPSTSSTTASTVGAAAEQGAQATSTESAAGASATASAAADGLAAKGYALGDIVLGDPEAPVTIIEYASLTCPHCANFHNGAYKEIKEKYIDTGKANMIVREVYFDQPGLWASAVARCGGESRFYAFLDVFYADQRGWAGAPGREAIVEQIRRIGRLGGLSGEQVDNCLRDQEFMQSLADAYVENAERDGVRSTPTFLIGGQTIRGNQSAAALGAVIDAALGE